MPITDPKMTRFNISLREGVGIVTWALENALGGEIFVPKIPSYRIIDIAKAIGPNCEYPITGIRPGEKLHEEMITSSDSYNTVDLGKYFAILPTAGIYSIDTYCRICSGVRVKQGFVYESSNNSKFLTVDEIRLLIRQNVDPGFEV